MRAAGESAFARFGAATTSAVAAAAEVPLIVLRASKSSMRKSKPGGARRGAT